MSDKPTTGASWYDEEMRKLREQLAAEREEHARELLAKQTRIEIFQKQLAAERESHEKELDVVEANWSAEVKLLRAQIAALHDCLS